MLLLTENGAKQHKPACARCGGTGYVYLWSVARSGEREWYCDRNGCKHAWSDADPMVRSVVAAPVIATASVLARAASVTEQPLHASRSGVGPELIQPVRTPVPVVP